MFYLHSSVFIQSKIQDMSYNKRPWKSLLRFRLQALSPSFKHGNESRPAQGIRDLSRVHYLIVKPIPQCFTRGRKTRNENPNLSADLSRCACFEI